ncbi:hypothetical protein [Methylotuvimicrobium sp. KM2]
MNRKVGSAARQSTICGASVLRLAWRFASAKAAYALNPGLPSIKGSIAP